MTIRFSGPTYSNRRDHSGMQVGSNSAGYRLTERPKATDAKSPPLHMPRVRKMIRPSGSTLRIIKVPSNFSVKKTSSLLLSAASSLASSAGRSPVLKNLGKPLETTRPWLYGHRAQTQFLLSPLPFGMLGMDKGILLYLLYNKTFWVHQANVEAEHAVLVGP